MMLNDARTYWEYPQTQAKKCSTKLWVTVLVGDFLLMEIYSFFWSQLFNTGSFLLSIHLNLTIMLLEKHF